MVQVWKDCRFLFDICAYDNARGLVEILSSLLGLVIICKIQFFWIFSNDGPHVRRGIGSGGLKWLILILNLFENFYISKFTCYSAIAESQFIYLLKTSFIYEINFYFLFEKITPTQDQTNRLFRMLDSEYHILNANTKQNFQRIFFFF